MRRSLRGRLASSPSWLLLGSFAPHPGLSRLRPPLSVHTSFWITEKVAVASKCVPPAGLGASRACCMLFFD